MRFCNPHFSLEYVYFQFNAKCLFCFSSESKHCGILTLARWVQAELPCSSVTGNPFGGTGLDSTFPSRALEWSSKHLFRGPLRNTLRWGVGHGALSVVANGMGLWPSVQASKGHGYLLPWGPQYRRHCSVGCLCRAQGPFRRGTHQTRGISCWRPAAAVYGVRCWVRGTMLLNYGGGEGGAWFNLGIVKRQSRWGRGSVVNYSLCISLSLLCGPTLPPTSR